MTRRKARSAYIDREKYDDIDDVLNYIGIGVTRDFENERIKMSSMRYQNFEHNGIECIECGVVGQYFMLERPRGKQIQHRHFNLYAVDSSGKEVLMTRDHILPVSLGGEDIVPNLRTMCHSCNERRGNPLEFPLISACPI